MSQFIKDLPHHDARAFERGFAVANLRVSHDVFTFSIAACLASLRGRHMGRDHTFVPQSSQAVATHQDTPGKFCRAGYLSGWVQDKILVAAEFPADFEKQYMRVSSRVRTFPPLSPTLSPLRGEGEVGGRFGA